MIELGSGQLTCEQIVRVARDREQVTLAPGVAPRPAANHAEVLRLAAEGPVYGRSAGVGALVTARLLAVPGSADQPGRVSGAPVAADWIVEHGDGLLRSRATTAGPPMPNEYVRAMTAVRLEQIAVELVAATRAVRLRALPVPEPLAAVWAACAALPAEMTDPDLTDDVRLAEGLLDVIAPFGADSGHDGSRTPDHPLQLEDGTL